jgi:hypothetical protein
MLLYAAVYENIILYNFNFASKRCNTSAHLMVEEFLALPGALEQIKLGSKQLFFFTFTLEEREDG